jgi:xyloglucan-specific exo-beta-1,4-glucanase
MAKNPFNENKFTIATDNGIFSTTDGAENWVNTYSDTPTHKVKYSPFTAGLIAVGIRRYGALLYSLDNGSDWTTITQQQLNYVAAQAIDFNFSGNDIDAYVSTPDLGVIKYQIQNLPLGTEIPELNENNLVIYPNPVANILNIAINNNFTQVESIEILTVTGQRIYTPKEATVDISNWSNGLYIIKVITTNGKSISKKVVKG